MLRLLLPLLIACALACSPKQEEKTSAPETKPTRVAQVVHEPAPAPAAALDADASGQSFKEGMVAICNSIDEVQQVDDPGEQQRLVAEWIHANVKNAKVRELFTIIGEMPPKQRPGMMSAAATKAGLSTCPIAEQ